MSTGSLDPTPRSRVKRLARRGLYDRAAINEILDEGLICHVGFQVEAFFSIIKMNGSCLIIYRSALPMRPLIQRKKRSNG